MSLSSLSPGGAFGARRVGPGKVKKKKNASGTQANGTPLHARMPRSESTPPDSLTRVGSSSVSSARRRRGVRSSRRALKQQPTNSLVGAEVIVVGKGSGTDRRAVVRKWNEVSHRVTVQFVVGGVSIVDASQVRRMQPQVRPLEKGGKLESRTEDNKSDSGEDYVDYGEDIDEAYDTNMSPNSSPAHQGSSKMTAPGSQMPHADINAPSPGSFSSVPSSNFSKPKTGPDATNAGAVAPVSASVALVPT